MASRVNVKFVVMLSVVLGLVFASVAGVAMMVLYKSGAENARLGDEAMERGDYKAADTSREADVAANKGRRRKASASDTSDTGERPSKPARASKTSKA